jgi:hypothetical protein
MINNDCIKSIRQFFIDEPAIEDEMLHLDICNSVDNVYKQMAYEKISNLHI